MNDPKTRIVGVYNRWGDLILTGLSDYYLSMGIEDQFDAIELGYVDE